MNIRPLQQICLVGLTAAVLTLTSPVFAQDAHSPDGPAHGGGMGRGQGVRGTVTSIAGNVATIKTDEGDTYKVTTGANTRFMKSQEPAAVTDIHVGDMLLAGGEVDAQAKTVGAAFVAIVDAEQVRKLREDLGKTWISGKITAMEDTKITVLRMDNVSQTILVDENTSFHKRHDSITMADIKVGDPVSGRGALKDGVFVAKQLNVGQGGMMGMGGGQGGHRHGAEGASQQGTPNQ